MMDYGDRVEDSTLQIDFTTHASTGALVAPSSAFANTDFRIYKDGSATQKTSTNGITVTSPFDGITGKHLIEIDTSNDTGDSGFWTTGANYRVEINSAKTVSGVDQSGVTVGYFSIENRNVKVDVRKYGGTAATSSGGRPEVNATHWGGTAVASANVLIDGGLTAAKFAANAITDAVVASDVTIASVTGAVGSVTGNVGGNVTGSVGSVTAAVTLPTMPTDWITAAGLKLDAVAEIQAGLATQASVNTIDDILDTEIPAIKAKTDQLTFTIANQVDSNALSGGGGLDAAGIRAAVGLASANLDSQLSLIPSYVADAVWDSNTDNWIVAGSMGMLLGNIEPVTPEQVDTKLTTLKSDLSTVHGGGSWTTADVSALATQSSVDDLPTNAELAASQASADDATLAAIAALNNLSAAQVKAEVDTALGDVGLTTTITGRIDAAVSTLATQSSVNTAQADITTLVGRLTSTRAGYLDNLSGGAIATQADINALNQSASRRIIMTTVGQFERPETGSVTRTVEIRTYDPDGAAAGATGTPTLTATGNVSGSLAANVGTVSNPATGVYRWEYTISSAATVEQIRFDASAVVSGDTLPMTVYSQVVDCVSETFTSADRTKIVAIYDKLPVNNLGDQTLLTAAIGSPMQAGSTVVLTDSSLTTAKLGAFVLAKTTNITGFNDMSTAQVNTEVDTALSDLNLQYLFNENYDPEEPGQPGINAAYLNELYEMVVSVDDQVSTTLTRTTAVKAKTDQMAFTVANQIDANALSGGGSGLDAAGVRAAVGLASASLDTQLADLPTVSEFNARTIAAASYFDPAVDTVIVGTNNDKTGYSLTQPFPSNFAALGINPSGHVSRVVLVDTTTTNTDMRGTNGANTTTPPTVAQIRTEMDANSTKLADIVADTDELQGNQDNWLTASGFSTHSAGDVVTALGTGSSLTGLATQASVNDLPTNAELATALAAADDAVLAAVATRASQASVDNMPTNAEMADMLEAADDAVLSAMGTPMQAGSTVVLTDASLTTEKLGAFILAKGTNLTGLNDLSAAQVNSEADAALSDVGLTSTITGRVDVAVSTRASQSSVDDLPTNAELASSLASADDAVLAAIAALNNLSSAQVSTLLTALAATLSTAHGAGSWATADVSALATAVSLAAVKADTLIAKNAGVVQLGTISNAGTVSEAYTYGGITVTYSGLDENGNRTGVTIT